MKLFQRVSRLMALIAIAASVLAGCTWFGSDKSATKSTSVFSVKAGQCFVAPKDVKSELAALNRTDCTKPHTQESYAIVGYVNADGTPASTYPGDDLLTKYAQGKCAAAYGPYVGVDYLDSKLFFTYLLPSARGWEQDKDRNIVCFVTTTGAQLTASVKGSKT
ncbi:MAG: hypothetical protein JWM76_3816 [Pseudonocardiales bacterium]|nr:hypothetical protein [Pseudonocardiales bacterium]